MAKRRMKASVKPAASAVPLPAAPPARVALAQDPATAAADTGELALDAALDIGAVSEVRRRLIETLVGSRRLCFDVRALTTVDTAGVQLLLAAAQECRRRGIELACRGESSALTQALTSLGLGGALEAAAR